MQLALESADIVCPLFVRYRNRSKEIWLLGLPMQPCRKAAKNL